MSQPLYKPQTTHIVKTNVEQSYRSTWVHQTAQQGNRKKVQRNMEICSRSRKKRPSKVFHMAVQNTFYSSVLATHKHARACTKYLGPNTQPVSREPGSKH